MSDGHTAYGPQDDRRGSGAKYSALVAVPSSTRTPAIEAEHVHALYERIAPHFSATRHSAWPRVSRFLRELQAAVPCALVLDAGCGNGKYVGAEAENGAAPGLTWLGLDRSSALLHLAAGAVQARECASVAEFSAADALRLPLRSGVADAVLCVAVLHHLSTAARRVAALRELLRVVAPANESWLRVPVPGAGERDIATAGTNTGAGVVGAGTGAAAPAAAVSSASGLVLVQAWALEQAEGDGGSGTLGAAVPAPGASAGGADLLVPWRMPLADPDPGGAAAEAPARRLAAAQAAGGDYDSARRALVVHRFCHMFAAGELETLARAAVEGADDGVLLLLDSGAPPSSAAERLRVVAAVHPRALIVEVVAAWWERGNHAIILRRLQ